MHRSIYPNIYQFHRIQETHYSWFVIINHWLNWKALEWCFKTERTYSALYWEERLTPSIIVLRSLWNFFTDLVEQVLICDDSTCYGSKCIILKICNLLSQNLHFYEPESRLDRSLEHRDWPICGHKCSTESGSTARRRLAHPEMITSSEKHTIESTRQTRIAEWHYALSNLHVDWIITVLYFLFFTNYFCKFGIVWRYCSTAMLSHVK